MFLRYLNVSISIFLAIFPADCCWRMRSEDKPLIYDVITCLDRNLNTCTAGNLGKQIRSDTETWKFIENSCRKYASEDSSTPFLGFGIVTRNGKIVSKHRPNLGTDIQILESWLVGWYMYCVTLRPHDIKRLQCSLNTPWKYILLIAIFYLSGESPPSTFFCYTFY